MAYKYTVSKLHQLLQSLDQVLEDIIIFQSPMVMLVLVLAVLVVRSMLKEEQRLLNIQEKQDLTHIDLETAVMILDSLVPLEHLLVQQQKQITRL